MTTETEKDNCYALNSALKVAGFITSVDNMDFTIKCKGVFIVSDQNIKNSYHINGQKYYSIDQVVTLIRGM